MNEQDLYMEFEGWDGTYLYVGGGYLYVTDAGLYKVTPVGEAHVEYVSPDYVLHECGCIPYCSEETLREWCEKNKLPIPWKKVSDDEWREILNYVC